MSERTVTEVARGCRLFGLEKCRTANAKSSIVMARPNTKVAGRINGWSSGDESAALRWAMADGNEVPKDGKWDEALLTAAVAAEAAEAAEVVTDATTAAALPPTDEAAALA